MDKRPTIWCAALTFLLVLLIFPTTSFSQAQQPTADTKPEAIENAQDLGELSLDELKARRASVEGSGDLAEPVKKNVLRCFMGSGRTIPIDITPFFKKGPHIYQKGNCIPPWSFGQGNTVF
mgnify:CR=1 FL=1